MINTADSLAKYIKYLDLFVMQGSGGQRQFKVCLKYIKEFSLISLYIII